MATDWRIGYAELWNGPGRHGQPAAARWQNGQLQISGRLYPARNADPVQSKAELAAFRQQWEGMNGQLVPIICPAVHGYQGMWIATTAATAELPMATEHQATIDYSGTFLPVRSRAFPLIEQTIFNKLRPNSDSVLLAGTESRVAWPNASAYTTLGEDGTATLEGGAVLSFNQQAPTPEGRRQHLYQADPATYLDGAARVEVLYPDGVWRATHGRNLPDHVTQLDQVRLANGAIRCSFAFNGAYRVVHERWDGATWQSVKFRIRSDTADHDINNTTPAVLANQPSAAGLRVYGQSGLFVDLWVHDGGIQHIEGTIGQATAGVAPAPIQGRVSSDALPGVSITGGMRASAADGNGQWWLICVPRPLVKSEASAYISTDPAYSADFAIAGGPGTGTLENRRLPQYYGTQSITRAAVTG